MSNARDAARPPAPAVSAPRVASVVAVNGRDEASLFALAAGAAGSLEPWLATAIREHATERQLLVPISGGRPEHMRAGVMEGRGGAAVVLGDEACFRALGLPLDALGDWPERLRGRGEHLLFVAVDRHLAGFISIVNAPGPGAPTAAQEDRMRASHPPTEHFPTETAGLPMAQATPLVPLADGESFELRIAPVTRDLGGTAVRLLAYNGSVPGPVLRVRQGSEVTVTVVNDGDLETTVHWHGLRLANASDGTTLTQPPIGVGGRFTYRLTFPDPGIYWYHPHIREDYGQEMGLYGTIVVEPQDPAYWPAVHREVVVTLDDILLEEGRVAPFSRRHPTYTAMGRFGNVLLVNGEPKLSMRARQGEVVRFYLTNTANTRVFNVALPGARLKLVGGDSGRCEREAFVDQVVIAPSERVVLDASFDEPGQVTLVHRTPHRTYSLGVVDVEREPAEPPLASAFGLLRESAELAAERRHLSTYLASEPQKTLALVAEMDMGEPDVPAGSGIAYVCPMHADVVADAPGRCPRCGMKLLAAERPATLFVCPMHPEVTSARADRCPTCGMKLVPAALVGDTARDAHARDDHARGDHARGDHARDDHAPGEHHHPAGIEWEDDMVEVNRLTNPSNMRWKLIDRETGAEGAAIDWRFRVGDRVKIRLVNEMDSDHPMHHPFHLHGAGRFLILARDGVVEPNLVWKDTVLVPTGQTVDILFDVTHPGLWMAHCHIAEHHESGMMLHFRVDPRPVASGLP